jgi:hypothetical protein
MKTLWTEFIGTDLLLKLRVAKNGRDHLFLLYKIQDHEWVEYHRYAFPIEHFNQRFSDINSREDVVWLALEFLYIYARDEHKTDKYIQLRRNAVMILLVSCLFMFFGKTLTDLQTQ